MNFIAKDLPGKPVDALQDEPLLKGHRHID
jgi:hypothetical protein